MKLKGKISFFGGKDSGMSHGENLSLYWEHSQCDKRPSLFHPRSSDLTEGTSHRLKENAYYIAVRFDVNKKENLRNSQWMLTNPVNGKECICSLVDWGPAEWTGRVCDASPEVGRVLELETDDEVEVELIGV